MQVIRKDAGAILAADKTVDLRGGRAAVFVHVHAAEVLDGHLGVVAAAESAFAGLLEGGGPVGFEVVEPHHDGAPLP